MVGRGHPLDHRPQGVHGNSGMPSPAALKFWELTLLACFADSLLGQNRKNRNHQNPSGPSLQQQILAFSNKLVSLLRNSDKIDKRGAAKT